MNQRTQKFPGPQIKCSMNCFIVITRTSCMDTKCVAKHFTLCYPLITSERSSTAATTRSQTYRTETIKPYYGATEV
jgi:hypothetical protein